MVTMLVIAFLLGYPIFMVFVWLVARMIFTSLEKQAEEQRKERELFLMKARRVPKLQRMLHA